MTTNIQLQDFTAIIHRTSQHNGGQFDTIHVDTLIVTDNPILSDDTWYVPNSKPIDAIFKSIFEHTNVNPQPINSSLIQERINDFADAIQKAEEGDISESRKDIATIALLHVLSKTSLNAIEGTSNTYRLSYDYRLYPLPLQPNTFELKVVLPFDGFIMPDNGDEIQITVVAPMGATIDRNITMGIDTNGNSIPPQYAEFPNSRKQAISFQYRIDPTFTIRYYY